MTASGRNKSIAPHDFQKHNSPSLPNELALVIEIIQLNCSLGSYLEFQEHYFTHEAHIQVTGVTQLLLITIVAFISVLYNLLHFH